MSSFRPIRTKLNQFNYTKFDIKSCLLHEFFEEIAKVLPDKIAAKCNDQIITYSDLNFRANQLAHYLIYRNIKAGDFIGISIKRSIDLLVAVLGVLKSGACYLPIDPGFPTDRIEYMLLDSGTILLITEKSLTEKYSKISISKVFIDSEWKDISSCTQSIDITLNTNESLAYLIYTSGSTGKPKGVKVHHRAVVNFLQSMSKIPGINITDNLLSVTTLSFDISVLEIFLPLSNGATVVMARSEDILDGKTLAKIFESENITILQATPATWTLIIGSGWKGKKDLKALCGGETISSNLVEELLPLVGSLWNMYGPTETTVWSTCCQINNPIPPILVGKPIDNTQIYILNKENNLQPIGTIGEICIGGLGVSKGYHNRPELTIEKFIKLRAGEIVYKTGDLGRLLEDGNIELFGRAE